MAALRKHLTLIGQAEIDRHSGQGFVPVSLNMSVPSELAADPRLSVKVREQMTTHERYFRLGLSRYAERAGHRLTRRRTRGCLGIPSPVLSRRPGTSTVSNGSRT